MWKLLIADDERTIRETISSLIDWDNLGIKLIGLAQNGVDAYNIIIDESPDIVLTDIKMPGLSGIELIQKIYEINHKTKFIILSGYSDFEYAKTAMKYGVRHYLLKPCNENQIIESINDIIEELSREKAFSMVAEEKQLLLFNMYSNNILSLINDALAFDTGSYANNQSIYSKYNKFIDIYNSSYEVFYINNLERNDMHDAINQIEEYRKKHSPGILFSYVYAGRSLFCFFKSYQQYYPEFENFITNLPFKSKSKKIDIQHQSHKNLHNLMETLLPQIVKHEVIYYSDHCTTTTICNYKNIISEMNEHAQMLFGEDRIASSSAYESIKRILSGVTDINFLKQLTSSLIIHASSKCIQYNSVSATEFLIQINKSASCGEIRTLLFDELNKILDFYYNGERHGELSRKIMEYVDKHLSDSGLSLKYIAENYLYMNDDYVSKKFLKETGQKFSNYLTERRIKKAKELLASSRQYKIQNIAEMVGCGNNPQYFSLLFKKHTGYSPTEYHKMMHKKVQ